MRTGNSIRSPTTTRRILSFKIGSATRYSRTQNLSRDSGFSGAVDLGNFNWSNYDLVVIDESHNFRNEDGMRYKKLMDEIIKSGSRTKVLMLSATPVNTSLIDLRNQIYLMTEGREDSFQESLGVDSIRRTMREAQKSFVEWEEKQKTAVQRDKQELLGNLGGELLSSVRRRIHLALPPSGEDILQGRHGRHR